VKPELTPPPLVGLDHEAGIGHNEHMAAPDPSAPNPSSQPPDGSAGADSPPPESTPEATSETLVRRERSRFEDPEAFLLSIIERADERLGTDAAEVLGAVAGATLALFVPFAQGLLLRGVIGSAIGSLVGKKIAEHDPSWFRRRLELALDRFEEINRFFVEDRCSKRARDEYVEDLIDRFFDKGDSLLE
jgi:hypothetical protein